MTYPWENLSLRKCNIVYGTQMCVPRRIRNAFRVTQQRKFGLFVYFTTLSSYARVPQVECEQTIQMKHSWKFTNGLV